MCQVYPVTFEDVFHFQFEDLFINKDLAINPMNAFGRVFLHTSFNELFGGTQCFSHQDLLGLWQPNCRVVNVRLTVLQSVIGLTSAGCLGLTKGVSQGWNSLASVTGNSAPRHSGFSNR